MSARASESKTSYTNVGIHQRSSYPTDRWHLHSLTKQPLTLLGELDLHMVAYHQFKLFPSLI